ncbi:MAG TPA: alpha/beta hydrolase [Thermomicrobiales bacterium]|nr:alpha/beta hydrolase [Thermomicrobiales bacterium]
MATHKHPVSTPLSPPASVAPALTALWARAETRIAAAAGIAALTGLLVGLVMPRGPVTTAQALMLMVTGAVTGIAAGFVLRSRWAMLLAPVAHVAAFELIRLGETGPTVDGIHPGTTFGILAFLVGRGVYGILGLLPMILGVAWGAALARRLTATHERHGIGFVARRAIGALTTVSLIALAVWIALPPSVAPVIDANGNEIPGSVSELTKVTLGGHDQWVEIRGASPDLPVLLYLSGGPGQSDLAFSRAILEPLTQDFLIVGWDQRGTGKSYPALDANTLTLDRAIADTIELTEYLRDRFDEQKIYVLGESWGSTLGVLAAQQRPDLYYALIGSGQMVSQRVTDQMIYDDLLAYADEHGDTGLAKTLRGFGPPPYGSILDYAYVLTNYEKIEGEYDPPQSYIDRGEQSGVGFWGMMGSEYAPIDKVNLFRGLLDMSSVMYPQLQEIDFRADVPTLDVPIYLFDGKHELRGRRELANEWFAMLDAPDKQMVTYENAGHAVAFEHADDLHRILLDVILPATYPAR